MQKDKYEVLKEWNDLLQIGAITEAEFLAKKNELLGGEIQTNNQPKASQSITPEQKKLIMIGGGIAVLFLVVFLAIKLLPKSESNAQNNIQDNAQNMPSSSTEMPKTEDTQDTQQTANQKYQSHNFYGNNVTEYLEVDASGNVFYSTSTRPNPVKMLVTTTSSNEFMLKFPEGTGDKQRYRMEKDRENIIITIPNTDAPAQTYTPIKVSANINHGWKTFKHKYGFSIELPDYFSEGMLTNDATQRYNLDGNFSDQISIATIGEGSQASLATAYQSTLKSSENVAYNVLQNNWFVITGQQKDGAIYYLKTMVKNGQTHYLSINYPNDQKEQFDRILPRIANSFQ